MNAIKDTCSCPTCGQLLLHSTLREDDERLIVACERGHAWYTTGFRSRLGVPDRFDLAGPEHPPRPKPYPTCIFCGAKANSREHAIPKWMAKRLGIKEFLPGDNFGSRVTLRKQPVSFASFRARIFCSSCNTHFKHLEDSVIPLIVPMATGRVLSIGPENQSLLALWATKTAIALTVATAPEYSDTIPLQHRSSVRFENRPPDTVWVGYLPWRGNTVFSVGEGDVRHDNGSSGSYRIYGSIFAFGQMAFSVIGFIDSLDSRDVIDGDRPAVRQFWPPIAPRLIDWPPAAPATSDLARVLGFVPLRRA